MKWQCALLQRWLPEYPDGDLPAWGKRWLKSHLARCSACRQELAELREVVAAIEATPVADPAPEFWREFSREMHLKLVQAAQEGQAAPVRPAPGGFGCPIFWGRRPWPCSCSMWRCSSRGPAPPPGPGPGKAGRLPQSRPRWLPSPRRRRHRRRRGPRRPPPARRNNLPRWLWRKVAPPPVEEVDISGWDLDAELAGMTDQEKNAFLNKLHQHKKDGSCIEGFSFCSWG